MKHRQPLTTLSLESCLAEYQTSSPCQTQSTPSQLNLSGHGDPPGSSVSEKSTFEATLLGIFMPWVYQFLVAAITSYHKLGGLKQKFILSQFWRPEIRNQFPGVKQVHTLKVGMGVLFLESSRARAGGCQLPPA